MKETIRQVWEQVDPIDYAEGMVAYERYRYMMDKIGEKYHHTIEQVTAAFVSLSPNNDYEGNVRSLITLLEAERLNIDPDEIVVSTYKACAKRAWDYLHGKNFVQWTIGPKILNFYHCILNPKNTKFVVIDGHMFSIWYGRRLRMKEVAHVKFNYLEVGCDFIEAANELKLRPCQLQSMLWFTWKRINNIRYGGNQLNLFKAGDHWGIEIPLEDVIPFPGLYYEPSETISEPQAS